MHSLGDCFVDYSSQRRTPFSSGYRGVCSSSKTRQSRDAGARQLPREIRVLCSVPRIPLVLSTTWRHHSHADRALLEYLMSGKSIRRGKDEHSPRDFPANVENLVGCRLTIAGSFAAFVNGPPAGRQCKNFQEASLDTQRGKYADNVNNAGFRCVFHDAMEKLSSRRRAARHLNAPRFAGRTPSLVLSLPRGDVTGERSSRADRHVMT